MRWHLYPVSEFGKYEARWQALNLAGANSAVLLADFLAPAIDHFATGKERLAIYGDPAEPRAMAILTGRGYGAWETFQPSQAPLGAWVCATALDIERALRDLLAALPRLPLLVAVTQQDPALTPRPAENNRLRTMDYIRTARVAISGTFADYWSARGRNLRHNLKRQHNRLEKEGIACRLETLTEPQDMQRAVIDYGRLESSGWKAEHGTAIHPDNAQGRFYREMLERFCRRRAARVYRYWYGEHLVATDLCLLHDGALIILKTTYDEAQKNTSPALLMRYAYFQQLFQTREVRTVEFYGRVMEWHTKWSSDIRTMYHVNYYRWPVVARLHALLKPRGAGDAASSTGANTVRDTERPAAAEPTDS